MVRLNGSLRGIFEDRLRKNFPDRFQKVMNQISELQGGDVKDSQFGRRMKGEGVLADMILQLFRHARKTHFGERGMPPFDLTKFRKGGDRVWGFDDAPSVGNFPGSVKRE